MARFQVTLLRVLHVGGNAAEMRNELMKSAENAGLSSYVAGFEDRMLVVASELVRKWGSKLH